MQFGISHIFDRKKLENRILLITYLDLRLTELAEMLILEYSHDFILILF